MMRQANSPSHARWLRKCHIVFAPKRKRKIIYSQYRRSTGDTVRILRLRGRGGDRGASDARPCAHAGWHPAEDHRVELYGLPEREKLAHDVREARQPQIQVRQQEVLAWGLLRIDCRAERGDGRQCIRGQEACGMVPGGPSVKEREDPFAG